MYVVVVSRNFAKIFVCKREYVVTNSAYLVTMTTICHCSTLEFGRELTINQLPRASADLYTPLMEAF